MSSLNRADAAFVKQGLTSFKNLSASAESYQYVSSHVAWSELHHVVLEACGLEELTRRLVPHNLRNKRPQVLYRVALEQSDYDQLNADIEQFRISLKDDYGLDVITVEDSSVGSVTDPRGIWDGARAVWSHVLMEVIDAYLYAAAVAAGADTFITTDGSLRDALNRISRPEEDWEELADSLKQALTEAWRLDPFVALPRSISPQEVL